jgi:acetyl esterase
MRDELPTRRGQAQGDLRPRPRRRAPLALLRWAAPGWALWCLAGGLLIVAPAPSQPLLFAGVALTECSLMVTAAGGVGLGVAALAGSAGARRIAWLTAAVSVGALVVSLIPVRDGLHTAAAQGVTVSLARYLPRPPAGAPSRTVTYLGADGSSVGRRLDVWAVPAGAGARGRRRPAVVLVHGGGWDRGSRGGSLLPGWLAGRGYVVFDIDYRLATPASPSWQQATGDVKCAVGWVNDHAARFGVDPGRIGLLGSSAGGHLALLAAYSTSEPALPASCQTSDSEVTAVAALYPVSDLAALYRTPTRWWDRSLGVPALVTRFVGGTPAAVPDRYRIASPITHADRGAPPTFLAHGTRDQVVPFGQSLRLARRLGAVGVPHRVVPLRGSNHGYDLFGGGFNSQTTLATLADFLGTWLGRQPPSLERRRPA